MTWTCTDHPERPATAYLYWDAGDEEEGREVCDECLMPTVLDLYETLQDIELRDPEIKIRPI